MIALANLHDLPAAVGRRPLRGGADRGSCRRPCTHLDLARLGHAGQAAGELLDHAVLEARAACRCRSPARRSVMPWSGSVLDLVHHRGGVQQRLRRDAADVQAHAAERGVALDQHGLHAEVGAAEGGRIAAGAGAEHQHLAFDVGLAGVAARRRCRRGSRRGAAAAAGAGAVAARRRGAAAAAAASTHQDHRAFADLVADLDLELLHDAGMRRRDLHRGLVGLDHDQRRCRPRSSRRA